MSGSETGIQWFIARDGKQHGPVSDIELRKLVELSHLKPGDLVWRQGFSDWRTAASVFPAIAETSTAATPSRPSVPAPTAPSPATATAAPAPDATSVQPAATTPTPVPISHPMAPGSSKFGTDAMSAPVAGTPKASEAKPFTPFSSTAASSSPAKPATENWQPNAPDTRADPTATRPLGNPPLRTAGPFPPQGAASPGPETRGKAPDMMPPTRYHEPEQPPRKRRKVLVAVLLIAMTGAGAWIASQFKDQILNAVQSEGSSRNNPAGATAAATVIPNTTQPPAPAPATAPAAAPVAASTGDVDQQLQSRGMWVAIKQEFPDWYQARVAEVVRLSAEQKDQAEINRYLIGEIVLLRRENAKHALAASTARHKELAAAFLANLKQLAAESGDGCYEFISKGEASAPIVSRMNDPAKSVEIEAQVVAVVGAIVEGKKQPAEHAAPVKTDYDVLAGELGRLGWTQADMQLFANPKELAKAPRDRVCNMLKDWFTAHLAIQDPSTQERLLFETLKPVIAG